MLNKLPISNWSEQDQPREKLERLGASQLTDAELLAILIGSGSTDESAVSLTQRILNDCNNNLNTLGKRTIRELETYKGMGPAKAITILAACELGKRRQSQCREERPDLGAASLIYDYMHPIMQDLDVEEFWVLYMNQGCRLIKAYKLSHGGLSDTSVDIRIIMKEALLCNATVVAVCHNHPSNNLKPSSMDDKITLAIRKACGLMRLHFLDHVIITDGDYYSYHLDNRLK